MEIAASRLAFSLDSDSAHARKREMKRYSRIAEGKISRRRNAWLISEDSNYDIPNRTKFF